MDELKIIASEPGWLVVDKACDVSVHNEPGRDLVSLVRDRLEGDPELTQRLAYKKGATISPVHRLDRETSGVMLLGVDPETVRWFSRQFEERCISKEYVAVVHGCFEESIGAELVWDRPLAPAAGGRDNPAGRGRKVPCTTRVQILDQSPHYTLIACTLVTGRKHQIRRHAKLAGHPVLGDSRYGSKRAVEVVRTRHGFSRLALHSRSLELELPGTRQNRRFESAIPPEFLRIMEEDRAEPI
ncbi:MAG: RNA pseudouridine synthase [Deltaproteobacteria bacterium]|nr:RNA pseudouridine synthase [Deltaproteobacteria bacterium]